MHTESFVAELQSIVGPNYVLVSADDKAPFLTDWRKRFTGKAIAVVMPASTEEVAAVVKCCIAAKVPIVTQGGNTAFVAAPLLTPAAMKSFLA
jgi:FAD/FMN-containing dehydrogenase